MEPRLDLTDNKIKNVRAIIWKDIGEKKFFLLTEEREGYFTIPGGCKDIDDGDLLSTLQREMSEELELVPNEYSARKLDLRKEYENLYNNPQSERFGKVTIVTLFEIYDLKKEPSASHEVKDVVWADKDEVLQKLNSEHMRELFHSALQIINK